MSVFFRPRPTKVEPEELRRRLSAALADELPGAVVEVRTDGTTAVLSWDDGPATSAVAGVVAGVVNWEVRAASAPAARPGPAVLLERRLSDAALAVAVVRYAGSNVRPYSSEDPRAVERLGLLLDEDEPATSGYPVVDRMAALLLEGAAPEHAEGTAPGATRADRLAASLTALGYDALWRVAWSELR